MPFVSTRPVVAGPTAQPDRTGLVESPVTCSRRGRHWRLGWGDRSVGVRHSVGMQHLAVLLNNPDQEIHALDLVAALDATASATRTGAAQPVLDQTALRQYRRRIADLATEIEEYEAISDFENAARRRAERDWLVDDLSSAIGIGGRIRPFPDSSERARVAVGKAIRRALGHIGAADAELGAHLREAVHTGIRCCYWRI